MPKEERKNKFLIHPLPVLTDNIIWIWVEGNQAVVVDPSIAEPVISWLKAKRLELKAILQTHHHEDHIGGTKNLLKEWPYSEVIASKSDLNRIPFQTISVDNEEEIIIMGYPIKILDIPGHTKTHIAFYLSDKKNEKPPILFCGDTLFASGCGRLFEGTPEDMFISLERLNSFPSETEIYCGHEYTEANLRWANSLQPKNIEIKRRLLDVIEKRKNLITTLPSTLKEERLTNLFIQAKSVNELSNLRNHKDNWAI